VATGDDIAVRDDAYFAGEVGVPVVSVSPDLAQETVALQNISPCRLATPSPDVAVWVARSPTQQRSLATEQSAALPPARWSCESPQRDTSSRQQTASRQRRHSRPTEHSHADGDGDDDGGDGVVQRSVGAPRLGHHRSRPPAEAPEGDRNVRSGAWGTRLAYGVGGEECGGGGGDRDEDEASYSCALARKRALLRVRLARQRKELATAAVDASERENRFERRRRREEKLAALLMKARRESAGCGEGAGGGWVAKGNQQNRECYDRERGKRQGERGSHVAWSPRVCPSPLPFSIALSVCAARAIFIATE